nr:winged helix DNA-binding domain-containing protein [Acidobacteriota bacterium]
GFVPGGERRHGYYVLPILEGERLIGRLDPKLDRQASRLDVRAVWWEPGLRQTAQRRDRLAAAVERLARLTGAARWTLPGSI